MSKVHKTDIEFKKWVGEFVIAFSELEHGIAQLCALSNRLDNSTYDADMVRFTGMRTIDKLNFLSKSLADHYPELAVIWKDHKTKLDRLNHERRFIVHGIYFYTIGEEVPALIKVGKSDKRARFSGKYVKISELKRMCNELHYLNSGENGINGELWEKLLLKRHEIRTSLNPTKEE